LQAGLRGRNALGVAGAVLVTLGAFVYSVMPHTGVVASWLGLHAVRSSPHAESWGLTLCFIGLGLMTLAWLALGIAVRSGLAGLGTVRRTAWLWAIPLLVAPPLFSGDGWSYAADAFLAGHGVSPYVVTPSVLHGPIVQAVCVCWRHTPAPYGPVALLWGGSVGHATSSPWLLMLWYRLLALVGLVLLMWALPRLARLAGTRPAVATWLVVASPFVLAVGIGGIHLDLIMAGLVAVALAVTPTRGWFAGALLIGVATAIKAPAAVAGIGVVLLALPSDSLRDRVRRTAEVGGVAAAVVVLLGVVTGWGFGWIKAMNAALVLRTPLSLTYDARKVLGYTGLPHPRLTVDTIAVTVLAVALLVLLWKAPVRRPAGALLSVAAAMTLTTLLSPITNYWYYLWCLPLLAVCWLPRAARCALAGFVLALGMVAPLDPALHLYHATLVVLGSVLAAMAGGMLLAPFLDRFPFSLPAAPPPGARDPSVAAR